MDKVKFDGLLIEMPYTEEYRDAVSRFGIAYQCSIQYHSERINSQGEPRFKVLLIISQLRNKLKEILQAI